MDETISAVIFNISLLTLMHWAGKCKDIIIKNWIDCIMFCFLQTVVKNSRQINGIYYSMQKGSIPYRTYTKVYVKSLGSVYSFFSIIYNYI